jgi:hypothetical protein
MYELRRVRELRGEYKTVDVYLFIVSDIKDPRNGGSLHL